MGLFDVFKKSTKPYKDDSRNLIYELFFCDNLDPYKNNNKQPYKYPWDILFSEIVIVSDLQKITNDNNIEARIALLAYNKLLLDGQKIDKKELLGIIVEIGLDSGLDVLASYVDGSARYINHAGKTIVWETPDETSASLTNQLFSDGAVVVSKIGPWNKPRRQHPPRGIARITYLVSDGLYFGEGSIDVLFNDPLSGTAMNSATYLMKYLIEKTLS